MKTIKTRSDNSKQLRLLDTAITVFIRFGFRKTSMDDIAQAAKISRQGLYLRYSTKEDLFVAAVHHWLDTSSQMVQNALGNGQTIEEKLFGAFDGWIGRFVGIINGDLSDLEEARDLLIGQEVEDREQEFLKNVSKAIASSDLNTRLELKGFDADDLTDLLFTAACGLKHLCRSHHEFTSRFTKILKIACR